MDATKDPDGVSGLRYGIPDKTHPKCKALPSHILALVILSAVIPRIHFIGYCWDQNTSNVIHQSQYGGYVARKAQTMCTQIEIDFSYETSH